MTNEDEYNPDNIKLTINVTITKRWVPAFLGFLNKLSLNSDIGHSSIVAFYADGDGDFRFKVDLPTEKNKEFIYEFDIDDYKDKKSVDFKEIIKRPILGGFVFHNVEEIYDAD